MYLAQAGQAAGCQFSAQCGGTILIALV